MALGKEGLGGIRVPEGSRMLPEVSSFAEPTEIKGITEPIEEREARKEQEKNTPIDRLFTREEIANAEGLVASEVGMMQSGDRPGHYYDENEQGDYNPQHIQRSDKGVTAGGQWRGVKSMRNALPFMKENPDLNPAQVEKALRNKDSAAYRKIMLRAMDFIKRQEAHIGEASETGDYTPGEESFAPEELGNIGGPGREGRMEKLEEETPERKKSKEKK